MHMDSAADRAADEAAQAGFNRVILVGLSMGGYVALAFWRRYRERVAGLVLSNTKAGPDDEAGKERRRALAERLRAEGNGFMVENPPPLLSTEASSDLWDLVKGNIRAQPAEAIAAASLGMGERPDSTARPAGIDVPTLVITSSGDTLIPPDATTPMASQIPGARLEVIDGARAPFEPRGAPTSSTSCCANTLGPSGSAPDGRSAARTGAGGRPYTGSR